MIIVCYCCFFFFQAEDGIRDVAVTGVQTCALPISLLSQLRHVLAGEYEIERECGRGGVAAAFKALGVSLRPPVALNGMVPSAPLGGSPGPRPPGRTPPTARRSHSTAVPRHPPDQRTD